MKSIEIFTHILCNRSIKIVAFGSMRQYYCYNLVLYFNTCKGHILSYNYIMFMYIQFVVFPMWSYGFRYMYIFPCACIVCLPNMPSGLWSSCFICYSYVWQFESAGKDPRVMERLQRCTLCTSASESIKRVTEDVVNAETGGYKNTVASQRTRIVIHRSNIFLITTSLSFGWARQPFSIFTINKYNDTSQMSYKQVI
jgi:hypothetical protein